MIEWIRNHPALLWTFGATSVVVFLGSLLVVPAIVVRIHPDYFTHDERPSGPWGDRHPVVQVMLRIAKNVLGCLFGLAGIAMLVLPGQGLLTLLVGFLMVDVPGKYRLEKWLVGRRCVLRPINWLRHRAGREALRAAVAGRSPAAGGR